MKPKKHVGGNTKKSNLVDRCYTPWYAIDPILPYIPKNWAIWESACGELNLSKKLKHEGYHVISTDILTGENFFEWTPEYRWDCQVTNPPYSVKYLWLERSFQLGIPFALLLPLETLGSAKGQSLFQDYGVEIVLLNKRVNFKMPFKGYSGGGAQFPTAWFTRYEDGQGALDLALHK